MTKNKCFSLKLCLASNIGLTGAALCLVTLLGSAPAFAQTPSTTGIRLADHTPPQVLNGTATFVGHYDPTQKLRLSFAIVPPHLQEEEQFLTELQTKGSPTFHQFLTPEEWNARFAPTPETEQSVVDWVTSQGFTVTNRFNHRLVVSVEAPVGVIEKALNITINRYQLQNKIYYSNDRDPLVPPQLSSVLSLIEGLNNIQRMRRAAKGPDQGPGPDYSEGLALSNAATFQADGDPSKLPSREPAANQIGPTPALGAAQQNWFTGPTFTGNGVNPLAIMSEQAYNYEGLYNLGHCCNPLNASSHPATTSIAVLEPNADFLDSDIQGFHQTFPYLAYDYNRWIIDGPVTCPTGVTAPCPSGEATLDVEWAIATSNDFGPASGTAMIRVYEGGPGATWSDLFGAILHNGDTRVLTTSYSCTELGLYIGLSCSQSSLLSFHNLFNQMVGEGWTLIAASGDRGATDNCSNTSVSYPSSDPDFVSAGGSILSLNSDGVWEGEVAWSGSTASGSCSHNDGGSGGGISVVFPTPPWQDFVGVTMRAVPDLALNMNNENVFFQGSLGPAGGTSIVAPAIAGFFAQANAYLLAIGNICGTGGNAACTPVGNPNAILYEEGNPSVSTASHYPYYDITQGCNSNDVTNAPTPHLTYFCAGLGYDEVTGWGSANMMQLAWALNWYIIPAIGLPSVDFQGPQINAWYNSEQKVSWTIVDNSGTFPGTGIAGFTQGWDSIPPDSETQPKGGSGDSFWDGPQFTNINQGCISLLGQACQGGVPQGCHTAHVRGWNNQGGTTGDSTYGPVCLDTTAPMTQITASGTKKKGIYITPVAIALIATDNLSGVASTTYSINGGPPQNYNSPFTVSTLGNSSVSYFSTDVAGNVEASQSFSFTILAPTTTALTASTLTSVFGQSVTFTATVTGTFGPTPSGTVTFFDGSTKLNASTLNAGTVAYATAALLPGTHNVTAEFAGDQVNLTSTSSPVVEIVADTTTTTLASGLNPSVYGQNITLTATVAAAHGGSVAGTVTFYNGANTLGTQTLNSSNQATFSTAALAGGSHSLKAVYAGNTSDARSASPVLTQVVTAATTTTALTSSPNPSVYGQAVQLVATITPADGGTVTGTVTFKDGGVGLGKVSVGANNTATFSTTLLATASHSLTAVYGGSASTSASTSPAVSQQVTIASTTAALSSNVNPSGWGQAVTITATIASAYGGAVTGTVTFKDGTTTVGTGTVTPATGVATYSNGALSLGTHTFTAVYSGDANNLGSAAAALNQTVVKATTSTTVKPSLDPSSWGQSIILTASVVPVHGTGEVTGTVTFTAGLVKLGTATLSNNQATFSTSSLALGTHVIWASYGGDTVNNPSDSATFKQVVIQAATSTAVASSLNPAKVLNAITFTATVTPKFGGTVTGTVTFLNGVPGLGTPTTLGTGTIDSSTGAATFTTNKLAAGTYAITAVYNGNANLLTSTSMFLTQTVDPN
jgi:Pro-kumamolisin, activation domain/Bacterial Ig-like domain (group 3)